MKKRESLLRATIIVSALIIFGKLLGFGRQSLIAAYYGATAETDAFFFAQSMPGMIFPAVCNSISTAFISLYVKQLTERGEAEGDRYASRMLWISVFVGISLSILGVILAPVLVPLFAPGFSGEQLLLAIHLTRLTMGAFFLTMMQYMLGAILNSKKKFIGSQVAGVMYNVAIIGGMILLGRGQSMDTLTLTVLFGLAVQILTLLFCCRKQFHWTMRSGFYKAELRQLFVLVLPILLGNAVIQINSIVDKALASLLPAGSVSALSYCNTLTLLVTSVFIMSLSTVLYPTLTADASSGDLQRYGRTLQQSLSGLSCLLVPISFITLIMARDIVQIVYARGSFSQEAAEYTAIALAFYAPMFVGAGIREILTRGFFAFQNTKVPMMTGIISVGCNILFSLLFVRYLGIAGIALGTTLASIISAVQLLFLAGYKFKMFRLPAFFRSLGVQLLAGAVMLLALLVFHAAVPMGSAFARFFTACILGFAVYFAVLFLLDRTELSRMYKQLRSR